MRVFYIEKSVYTLTRINPYELMCICNAKKKTSVGAGLKKFGRKKYFLVKSLLKTTGVEFTWKSVFFYLDTAI